MKTSPSNPLQRVAFLLLHIVLVAAAGLRAPAQAADLGEPQPAAPYKVGTVTVRFVGVANVSEDVVRANMQVREGFDLTDTLIDNDIRALYRTGVFEFIEVKRETLPGRIVNLVVEVTPKYRVLTVRYEGNKKIKSRRLQKEVKSKANDAVDERQVKEDAEKIREFYQKKGYNQIAITYAIDRDRTTGFGTITFKIKEGEKIKLVDVRFVGNTHIKARRLGNFGNGPLVRQMKVRRHWMFSWLTGSGKLKDEQFEDDLDKIRDYYREHGYLDIDIPQDKIIYDYPTPKKLVITLHIEEGRQYRVGDITFSGNKLHSTRMLNYIVKQHKGAVFVPSKIDKDVEALEDYYGRDGYLETRVHPVRKPNITTGNIDIEYQIEESEKFYVESVRLEGNHKTKSIVIIRELVLGPGEVFNTTRMKISKARLENTRYFSDVNTSPETTNIPGRRTLKIALHEDRTGNLQFGAGYSSLERLVFFAEVTQSNFDLFNRKGYFQGDGQKARVRLQIGSYSNEVTLSFEEPWLFEKQLALGFELFRTSSKYDNQYYNLMRVGATVYLRKHLVELIDGTLSYTIERDTISDVSSAIAGFINEGDITISRLSLQLVRDTRDKLVNTLSGDRVEFNASVSGGALGGDLDVYSLELRTSRFIPVFDTQNQTVALLGRGGVVNGFGRQKGRAGFNQYRATDGYFLGGPYSLRGFENRDVGPKTDGGQNPIGGRSYGFMSLEYSLDIVDPIRFALFYDAGFVNEAAYDFNPSAYADNIGFGVRMFVAGAPLSLDYALPLTRDRYTGSKGQFNFSFGTRF